MIVSGIMFYCASVTSAWETLILLGRLLAGFSHGLTYVTIFVHASENASKEFRHYLTTAIGLTISFSIFISAFIIYIPMPELELFEKNPPTTDANSFKNSELTSAYVIMCASLIISLLAIAVNYFCSHETFAFLLANDLDDEASVTLAKLNGKDLLSSNLDVDVGALKEMCNNDNTEYARWSLFSGSHKIFMLFAMCARFAAVFSINLVVFVLLVKYFQNMILKRLLDDALRVLADAVELNIGAMEHDDKTLKLDIYLLKHLVKAIISLWFICGIFTTLIGSYFVWRRSIHFTTFLAGPLLLVASLFYFINSNPLHFKSVVLIALGIYSFFMSMPVDIIGYMYLTDCFPTSTKSRAIASITIIENVVYMLVIALNLSAGKESDVVDIGIEILIYGILLTIFGLKLFRTAPETRGLSLADAQQAFVKAKFL